MVGLVGLVLLESQPLLEGLHRAGQRLAGMGTLQWADAAGDWHAVARADADRLTWSEDTAFLNPDWRQVVPGLETADLRFARPPHPQTIDVALTRFDPSFWAFRVVGYPDWAEHTVAEFADTFDLTFAVNASFFSDEGPIGLVVQDGKVRHRQASRRAAHFLMDTRGGPACIKNEKLAAIGAPWAAFQGFPAIMEDGKLYNYIRSGGRGFDVYSVDRRTAACTDREGRLVILVTDSVTNGLRISELGVILGGLGCVDAMGFDGGSSTAMELRVPGHERSIAGLKPVQVVLGAEPVHRTP